MLKTDNASELAPVLVTGATGYVAGWIVQQLLEQGRTVHASVRDPDNQDKLRALNALAKTLPGQIRLFKADLLEQGSFAQAMRGCEVIFHTASPFVIRVDDPQRDLVDPAVLGTRNVLQEANRTDTVTRVVVTSSCAAIYGDNADVAEAPGRVLTEGVWNTSSSLQHQPYSYSKTLAEQEAWAIAERQDRWRLVTVNPSLVLGPAIDPNAAGESISLMRQLGDGTMRIGVPDYGIGVVDVRDVATAHLAAAFLPEAAGRYITCGHNSNFPEVARILRENFGDKFPFPRSTLPKGLVWLVGPLADKSLTRKVISRNVGWPFKADNTKSRDELGMSYRPLTSSVVDMFQQMLDAGNLK